MQDELNFEGVEKQPLRTFTEKAYLDYSMYVILDRALPALGDGLKPVQRRIIYAMSELGLSAGQQAQEVRAHRRRRDRQVPSARRLAPATKPWCSWRRRSPTAIRSSTARATGVRTDDPKSFAAMRYTESKLTEYAEVLLAELVARHGGLAAELRRHAGGAGVPAGAPAEPAAERHAGHRGGHGHRHSAAQPARSRARPASTCWMSRRRPRAALMKHVKGPDLPTGAEIISPRSELLEIYDKGNGSFKARAIYEIEDGNIVITALPYQVSGSKIRSRSPRRCATKKLPMVEDIRDESDHENPTRLVIVPRSNRVDMVAADERTCSPPPTSSATIASTSTSSRSTAGRKVMGLRDPARRVAGVPHHAR